MCWLVSVKCLCVLISHITFLFEESVFLNEIWTKTSVLSRPQGGILGVNFKFENEMFNSELTLPYFNKKKTAYFFVKLSLAFYLCPNSLLCIPLHMYKWTLNLTSSPWDESTFSLGSAWKSFSEEYTSCAGLAVNLQYTSSRDMDEQSHISSFCAERLTILVFCWVQLIKKTQNKTKKEYQHTQSNGQNS